MPHLPAGNMPIPTSSGYHPDVTAVEKTSFSRATICTRHHVPTRKKLSTAQIRADMAGIYSSAPHKSDHDDDP